MGKIILTNAELKPELVSVSNSVEIVETQPVATLPIGALKAVASFEQSTIQKSPVEVTKFGSISKAAHGQTIENVLIDGQNPLLAGKFVKRDLSLNETPTGYAADKSVFAVNFAKKMNDKSLVTITLGDSTVACNLLNADSEAEARVEKSGKNFSIVRYENVAKGLDVQYVVTSKGLKENFIVRQKLNSYKFKSSMAVGHLDSVFDEETKTLTFKKGGVEKFRILSPKMFDAAGVESNDCAYEIEGDDQGNLYIVLSANASWIEAPERKFPVTIDPTIEIKAESLVNLKQFKNGIMQSLPISGLIFGRKASTDYDNLDDYKVEVEIDATKINALIEKQSSSLASCKLILPIENKARLTRLDSTCLRLQGEGFARLYRLDSAFINSLRKWAFSIDISSWIIGKEGSLKLSLDVVKNQVNETNNVIAGTVMPVETVMPLSSADEYTKLPSLGIEDISLANKKVAAVNNLDEKITAVEANDDVFSLSQYWFQVRIETANNVDCSLVMIYQDKYEADYQGEKEEIDSGKSGKSYLNLFSGNLTHIIPEAAITQNSLKLKLSHVFDERILNQANGDTYGKYLGQGWKTNFHQYLIKADAAPDDFKGRKVTYIDGNGDSHYFEEKWFYQDDNGIRHEVSRSDIYLDDDHMVKCVGEDGQTHEVESEAKNNEGMIFVSGMNLSFFNPKKTSETSYYAQIGNTEIVVSTQEEIWNLQFYYYEDDDNGIATRYFVSPSSVIKNADGSFESNHKKLTVYTLYNSRIAGNNEHFRYQEGAENRAIEHTDGVIKPLTKFDDYEVIADIYQNKSISDINARIHAARLNIKNYEQSLVSARNLFINLMNQQEGTRLANEHTYVSSYNAGKVLDKQELMTVKEDSFLRSDGASSYVEAYLKLSNKYHFFVDPTTLAITYQNNFDKNSYEAYSAIITAYNNAFTNYSTGSYNTSTYQYKIAHENIEASDDSVKYASNISNMQGFQQEEQIAILVNAIIRLNDELTSLLAERLALIEEQKLKVNDIIVDNSGNRLGFDGYGRLILVEDRYQNKINVEYENKKKAPNKNDCRILTIFSNSEKVIFTYDKITNLLESITDDTGRRTKCKYDDNGNLNSLIAPSGLITSFGYNGFSLKGAMNHEITFGIVDGKVTAIDDYVKNAILSHDKGIEFDPDGSTEKIKTLSLTYEYSNGTTVVSDALDDKNNAYYGFDAHGILIGSKLRDYTTIAVSKGDKTVAHGKYSTRYNRILQDNLLTDEMKTVSVKPNDLAIAAKIPLPPLFMLGLIVSLGTWNDGDVTLNAVIKNGDAQIRTRSLTIAKPTGQTVILPIRIKKSEITSLDLALSSTGEMPAGIIIASKLVLLDEGVFRNYEVDNQERYNLVSEERVTSLVTYDSYHDGKTLSKTEINFTNPDHEVTINYSYNSEGQLTYKEDSDGNVEEHLYDSKGNEIETKSYNKNEAALLKGEKKTYDESGNLISTGKRKKMSSNNKGQTVVNYKNNGESRAVISSYERNTNDLLSIVNSSDGVANYTSFAYRYNLLTTMQSHDTVFAYDYDGRGRKTAAYLNERLLVTKAYEDFYDNAELHIAKGTHVATAIKGDEVSKIADTNIEQFIDEHGRMVKATLINGDIHQDMTETYDDENNGRKAETLATITGKDNAKIRDEKISYTYDDNGRLSTMEKNINSRRELKVTRGYDDLSRNNSITTAFVTDEDSYQENFVFNNIGAVIKTEMGDYVENISYDAIGRVKAKILRVKDQSSFSNEYARIMKDGKALDLIGAHNFKISNAHIDSFTYRYDDEGNITSVISEDSETRFKYDGLNRLIREDNPNFDKTIVYLYDETGNILRKKVYKYSTDKNLFSPEKHEYVYAADGWKDQLVVYDGKKIIYDALGRPLNYIDSILSWDERGDLSQASSNNSGNDVTYIYDAQGIRIGKEFTDTKHIDFIVNGMRVLRESIVNGDSTRILTFKYLKDELVGFTLREGDTTKDYIYARNIQGDIVRIYEENGTLVAQYYYDAYGNQKIEKIDQNSDIADINPFRYRGYFFDNETGFYYLNARYYDPNTGRFISPDSLSVLNETKAQLNGLNLYMYCGDNPVMRIDPTGETWWDIFIGTFISIVAIIGGLVAIFLGQVALGAVLLSGGISGLIKGTQNYLNGGTFSAGAIGGLVGGLIAGMTFIAGSFVVGIMANTAFAMTGAALEGGISGFTSTVIADLIDKSAGVSEASYAEIFTQAGIAFALGTVTGLAFGNLSIQFAASGVELVAAGIWAIGEQVILAFNQALGDLLELFRGDPLNKNNRFIFS